MCRVPTLCVSILLVSCAHRELLDKANTDFKVRYPQLTVVKTRLGNSDADHAYVYIDYLYTPSAAFPSKPSIMEMKMGYRKADDRWNLFLEQGSRYIGSAH